MEGSLLCHTGMVGSLRLSAAFSRPGQVDAHGPLLRGQPLVNAEGVERLRPGNLVQLAALVQVIACPVGRKLADHRLEAKGTNDAESLF